MKHLKTLFIVAALLFLLLILTFRIVYHYDIPQYSGNQSVAGLVDSVEIFTDDFSVPYIHAKNNEDIFFTIGYLVAQERLFQLSLLSSIINGDLKSLLGDDYSNLDHFIKREDNPLNIIKDVSFVDSENIKLLEAYCAGINAYIEKVGGSLPISFKTTNSRPLKWSATDAVNSLMLMTNNGNSKKREKFVLSTVNQYFGGSRYAELNGAQSVSGSEITDLSREDLELEYEIYKLFGATGSFAGSSSTIIQPLKTLSKKPILIFDDIWGYQQPAKWFDLILDGGDFHFEGSIVPGFPIPLIGKTESFVYALNDQAKPNDLDVLFDLARNSKIVKDISKSNMPISIADTSGNYFNNNDGLKHQTYLINRVENIDNIQIEKIFKILSEYVSINKTKTISDIIQNYLNTQSPQGAISELLNWDGDESSSSTTALLVNTIYKNLIEKIFKDELSLIGNDIYSVFISNTEFVENSLLKVLETPESSWLDDINTINYRENISDIIRIAIERSLTELKTNYGNLNFKWGEVNQPAYKHILGDKKIHSLLNGFNIRTVLRRGSSDGININEFIYDKGLTCVSGVVLRKIYDLSDIETTYSILPTGQSGLPKSPNYSDQQWLFKNHEFRKVRTNLEAIRNNEKYQKLILYPVK